MLDLWDVVSDLMVASYRMHRQMHKGLSGPQHIPHDLIVKPFIDLRLQSVALQSCRSKDSLRNRCTVKTSHSQICRQASKRQRLVRVCAGFREEELVHALRTKRTITVDDLKVMSARCLPRSARMGSCQVPAAGPCSYWWQHRQLSAG